MAQMNPLLDGVRITEITTTAIEAAGSGDNTIIAAPAAGLRTIILHFNFLARGTVNVRFRSAATNISGLYNCTAQLGYAFDGNLVAPIVLGTAEAFVVNLSAAVGIDGFVIHYTQRN